MRVWFPSKVHKLTCAYYYWAFDRDARPSVMCTIVLVKDSVSVCAFTPNTHYHLFLQGQQVWFPEINIPFSNTSGAKGQLLESALCHEITGSSD